MRKKRKKIYKNRTTSSRNEIGSGKYFLLISVSLIAAVVPSHNILTHDALGQGPSVVKEQVSNILNTSDISSKLQNFENLTSFFGSPIYQETSHKRVGSVTVNTIRCKHRIPLMLPGF